MLLHGEEPLSIEEVTRMTPLRLAYIGDTIWDLMVRTELVFMGYNVHHMHQEAVGRVNANAQATAFRAISPSLTEAEAAMARRGRNAHSRHPVPKHQTPEDYQAATALETLFGYLYLTGQRDRLRELFSLAQTARETRDENYAKGGNAL